MHRLSPGCLYRSLRHCIYITRGAACMGGHVTVRARSACSPHIPIYFWSATLLLMPESGSTSHAQVQHCSQSSQSSATHYIHTDTLATQTPYKPNTQTMSLCIGPSKHRTYQVLPSVSLATLRQVIPASCAALFLIDERWCSHTYVCTPAVLCVQC